MKEKTVFYRLFGLWCVIAVCLGQGCSETDDGPQTLLRDGNAVLTGRMIDVNGNQPVADFPLFIQYFLRDTERRLLGTDTFLATVTDKKGRFSFTDVGPGDFGFTVRSKYDRVDYTPYELISVKIGELTYYPRHLGSPHSSKSEGHFSIDDGVLIEDIEIRVKKRMRIRGKVSFKNGMPLTYWPIHISTHYKGSGLSSTYNTDITTDERGYFTRYVSLAGLYTITVRYQHLTATSAEFSVRDGEDRDALVLIFDSQPIPKASTYPLN